MNKHGESGLMRMNQKTHPSQIMKRRSMLTKTSVTSLSFA